MVYINSVSCQSITSRWAKYVIISEFKTYWFDSLKAFGVKTRIVESNKFTLNQSYQKRKITKARFAQVGIYSALSPAYYISFKS